MPWQKGQKPFLNNGAGRKSAYQEKVNAEFLAEFFFKKHTAKEVKELIEVGKAHSVSDKMLQMALKGDRSFALAVFNKLFPDNLNLNTKGKIIIQLAPEIANKNAITPSPKSDS